MMMQQAQYPVQFSVDYPDRPLNRLTTAFRIFVAIPILIVIGALSGGSFHTTSGQTTTYIAGRRRAALPAASADDPVPSEVSPMVVRLEPQPPSLHKPRHGVLGLAR